jgi:RNA-directed DNA polymerase
MAIGDLQKNLQSRVRKGSKNLEQAYVWDVTIRTYSDLINHNWLLKNTPFPVKYKYILKSWLKLRHIEFVHNQPEFNNSETLQVQTISRLLLNFTLNGLENLINEEIITYQKSVPKSRLKYSSDGIAKLYLFHKLVDGRFKERHISCRFFRYANNYIVLCSSPRLLSLIKKKTCQFLQQRGLVIHPNKTKTVKFVLNKPFDFLGYTFIYLVRTKFIKNKMLHGSKPEYRLDGRPRLFVHPSRLAIKSFKTRLKNLLKKNYNVSAYRLIALLNPIIRNWVNYYSFSNSSGALSLLRNWIYKRIVIWLKRKHPKSGIIWLNKHYFLMEHLIKEHDFENNPKIADYIANLSSANQIQRNKWNFYGIARKSAEGYYYEIPRINIMLWPNSIKNITVASALVPCNKLLSSSYYLNQNKWLKEREKVERLHTDKENKLFSSLWKRDKGICFLCQTPLAEELTSFENSIEIHHIKPFAEGGSNKLSNMALVHLSCHTSWHQEYFIQSIETKEKLTKNRQKFK